MEGFCEFLLVAYVAGSFLVKTVDLATKYKKNDNESELAGEIVSSFLFALGILWLLFLAGTFK